MISKEKKAAIMKEYARTELSVADFSSECRSYFRDY